MLDFPLHQQLGLPAFHLLLLLDRPQNFFFLLIFLIPSQLTHKHSDHQGLKYWYYKPYPKYKNEQLLDQPLLESNMNHLDSG